MSEDEEQQPQEEMPSAEALMKLGESYGKDDKDNLFYKYDEKWYIIVNKTKKAKYI